ncbi:MAG TPA: NAD-dependent epimerase/dehydratase family protein [Candidatus Angelobacter sp.]|jgi:nucleoside-diphosphate-sugar epimerase|nr:NAD-dependent epimerase/dehydratase family protein [Candidatus Angelobacter sp.]
MKILLIGGSGFIGPFTAAALQKDGHHVTIFHRGKTSPPQGTEEILGDRQFLQDHQPEFRRQKFDVVIDFVLSSGRQAQQLMDTFRGIAGRVVGLSSMDVYRAWGVFYNAEPGGLQELPLTEDSELRTSRNTYPPEALKRAQAIYGWLDAEYDKIPVEQAVLSDPKLPGTILRLPMIYGPGDPAHRFHPILKRIDDHRKQIIFADDVAPLRTPRGYVEDVSAAVALAAISPQSAGRIYNVCESESFGELDWARKIATATNWTGEFVVLPHDSTPKHLLWPGNTAQHVVGSSERIRKELGYRELLPREEAIRRTIEWEKADPPGAPLAQFDYQAEDEVLAQFKATA